MNEKRTPTEPRDTKPQDTKPQDTKPRKAGDTASPAQENRGRPGIEEASDGTLLAERNSRTWLFAALLLATAGGGFFIWNQHLASREELPQARIGTLPPSTAPASAPRHGVIITEEQSRFNVLRQQLTRLQSKHEELSAAYLELRKEVDSLRRNGNAGAFPPLPPLPPLPAGRAEPESAPPPPAKAQAPVATPEPAPREKEYEQLINTLENLSARLDTLQRAYEQQSGISETRLKVLQAIDRIRDRLAAGQSYEAEVAELARLSGSENAIPRAAIHTLQENAGQGVPTMASLINDFGEIARLAVPVSLYADEKATFGDRLRARFGHLITIRKKDANAGDDSDEANVARAEAELRAGNVDMAIAHLEQLGDEPKQLFSGWLRQANNYLNAHEAIDDVKALVLEVHTPGATPVPEE